MNSLVLAFCSGLSVKQFTMMYFLSEVANSIRKVPRSTETSLYIGTSVMPVSDWR